MMTTCVRKHCAPVLHRFRAARDGGHAGTAHFNKSERPHQLHIGVDLARRPGYFENKARMRGIERLGAETWLTRMASTRFSPVPATFTSAISRSMPASPW
jgi:hypothetical protein